MYDGPQWSTLLRVTVLGADQWPCCMYRRRAGPWTSPADFAPRGNAGFYVTAVHMLEQETASPHFAEEEEAPQENRWIYICKL